MPGEGGELVGRGDEGQPGQRRQFRRHGFGEAVGGVEPGADGGAALGQLVDRRQRSADGALGVVQLGDESGQFLAEGDGRGVHQVGAPGLHQAGMARSLLGQATGQLGQRRQQVAVDGLGHGDVHGGGEAVVGALGVVDVVVGVHRALAAPWAASQFVGAAGDHFVDVHVALGAAAGLPDHQGELVVVLVGEDFVGGLFDQAGDVRADAAVAAIHPGGGLFHQGQGMHHGEGHAFLADGEVFQRALGLGAPVGVFGDADGAQAVGFGSAHCVAPGSVFSAV